MNPPPPPSRSSFDKASLQEVISRYGWSKDVPSGKEKRSEKPAPVPQVVRTQVEIPTPAPVTTIPPLPIEPVFDVAPKPSAEPTTRLPQIDPKIKEDLEAAQKTIVELKATLEEKEEQIRIVSDQCNELKERGDEFEKSAFKENAELLKFKTLLEAKSALVIEQEKKILLLQQEITAGSEMFSGTVKEQTELEQKLKIEKEQHEKDIAEWHERLEELKGQLVVEGGVSVHDSLAKYKQQAKQGAELLKQSLAESRRLDSEVKVLQARLEEEKTHLSDQLIKEQDESKVQVELEEKLRALESANGEWQGRLQESEAEIADLKRRLQESEAQATNSQAAVSHAMDFAYQATQDNELMKKKLAEAGIRM